jgi:succinate-acetate transporter protein
MAPPSKPEESQKNTKIFNGKNHTRDSNPEPLGYQSVVLTTAPLGRFDLNLNNCSRQFVFKDFFF